MSQQKTIYTIAEYVNVAPGEPFRLFPFGTISRGDERREVTPEAAALFKLPHFRPPIKLGGHADNSPAGGHIVGLEVRDDGIYAIPEFNDEGRAALERGAFRYHSPEIIWEGFIEDAMTGSRIDGPVIMGVALLHNPALGEAAALYSVEAGSTGTNGGHHMTTQETVQVPAGLVDRFNALIDGLISKSNEPAPDPTPEPAADAPAVTVEEYEAVQTQVAEYEARIATLEAEANQAARVAHFAAELSDTATAEDAELHELLATLDDEQAAPIVQRFKALSAQIDESNLTADIGGNSQEAGDPLAAIDAYRAEHPDATYTQAYEAVKAAHPDLFTTEA